MNEFPMPQDAVVYVQQHKDELIALLNTLTLIPSPSNLEEKRAEFCKTWLEENGCHGSYIDEAKNIVYPYRCEGKKEIIAFLAHTDTVFPDMDISWNQEGDIVHAMGVGDDTAGVAVLLMIARFVTQNGYSSPYGLLFVGDSGEEGLGNLKGSRKIVEDYGDRIHNFISFDGGMAHCQIGSVGSHRYEVTVKTEGGHSYGDFGNRNAIFYASSIINSLYAMKAPTEAKTSYNVGMISGGISVNTIPNECRFLYEYRSESQKCLDQMEAMFFGVIEGYQKMNISVSAKVLATRPCKGKVDETAQRELLDRCLAIIQKYHGDGNIWMDTNSTDANIPWSVGIPSTSIGVIRCGGAHTREEWADLSSLSEGFLTAMNLILSYVNIAS